MESHTEDLEAIKTAYVERSGEISLIKFDPQPKVVDVKVEDGVQVVRVVSSF